MADERAAALSGQFVIDGHTHFLRDDTRLMGFVKAREAVGKAGWNKSLGREGTDHRRSEVQQLYQRDVHGQRHQGGAAVELAVGSAGRLVHPAGAGVRDPREGQQGGRLAPHAGAFHLHPGLARLARPGRRGGRALQAGFLEGLHGRRQHPQGAGQPSLAARRRKADVPVLREGGEDRASGTSASTRGCSRRRSSSNSRNCGPMPMSAMSARPRRTGRSSIS